MFTEVLPDAEMKRPSPNDTLESDSVSVLRLLLTSVALEKVPGSITQTKEK